MRLAFWIAVGFTVYTYLGYPLILCCRSRWWQRPVRAAAIRPTVSIVVAARNEEAVLAKKLHNLAELHYPRGRYEVIVVSDGSSDGTNAILAAQVSVRAFFFPYPMGKAVALNRAVQAARGEIIVFTDARQIIGRDSVRVLVENFADPSVGCVTGELVLDEPGGDGRARGISAYWSFEKKIRKWESATGSVIGATGALYAIRRELVASLPAGLILDDVYLPLQVIRVGKRVAFESRAIAFDNVAGREHEFGRKVRTLVGNYQLLRMAPWLLTRSNPARFGFVSHKLFRLWVPFSLAAILVCSWGLSGAFYGTALGLQLATYGLAGVALFGLRRGIVGRLADVSLTFLLLNTAAAVALFYFLKGKKEIWVR